MKQVEVYTDGACSGNPGPGGWGAVLRYRFNGKVYEGGRTVELSCPLNEALVFEREEEETWNCAI